MGFELRPYQKTAVEEIGIALSRYRKAMFYAPTGAGKGFLFGYLAKGDVMAGRRVLIISSRTEIMHQNMRYLKNFGIESAFVNPKMKGIPEDPVVVAMAQTLKNRVKKAEWREWLRSFDICYIDEAQECVSDFLHPHLGETCMVCGMSGSPHRYGKMKQLGEMYRCLVSSVTVAELIDMGYLARPHLYSIAAPSLEGVAINGATGDYNQKSLAGKFEDKRLYKGVVSEYNRIVPGKKAICFCVSAKQAIEVTREFNASGVSAKYLLSGSFDDDTAYSGERSEVLAEFERGEFTVLVNVGCLVAGFDAPDVEVVIANYATTSLVKWRQSLGRGARTTETKKDFYILDCGANYKRLGKYEDEHTNCLWHDTGNSGGLQALKQCDPGKPDINGKLGCGEMVPNTCKVCPNCGRVFVTEKHEMIMHLEEVASGDETKDLSAWAAKRLVKDGWKLARIMIQIALANPEQAKRAICRTYSELYPAKTPGEVNSYWHSFKKIYLPKIRR